MWNVALWDKAFLGCWAGTYFGLPCSQVCQVCLGSSGSWLRPSDMDSREPTFMSCVLRLILLESQGAVPQALTLLRRARFIAWCLRHSFLKGMLTGPDAFLGIPDMAGLHSCTWTHFKIGLEPHSPVWWGMQQISVPIVSTSEARSCTFVIVFGYHNLHYCKSVKSHTRQTKPVWDKLKKDFIFGWCTGISCYCKLYLNCIFCWDYCCCFLMSEPYGSLQRCWCYFAISWCLLVVATTRIHFLQTAGSNQLICR